MARRPDPRRQRLTGRVALVLTVVATALVAVLLLGGVGAEAGPDRPAAAGTVMLRPGALQQDDSQPAVAGTVTLQPGGTMWGVAVDYAPPDIDPRVYLERLRALNNIDGSRVPAWTVLLLPR